MAGRKKWTNDQRAAVWRLHREGLSSPAIADYCAAGDAGLPPFEIPRRTVSAILQRMKQNGDGEKLEQVGVTCGCKEPDLDPDELRAFSAHDAEATPPRCRRCELSPSRTRALVLKILSPAAREDDEHDQPPPTPTAPQAEPREANGERKASLSQLRAELDAAVEQGDDAEIRRVFDRIDEASNRAVSTPSQR